MKKRSGVARAIEPISIAELENLPTGALLARLKRLRFCEEGAEHSDLSDLEIQSVDHLILFKSEPSWKQAYADVRAVLAGRDHVE